MFDLGLSSNQLADSKRGFSFDKKGPLDMSMGKSKLTASDIINKYSEKEIADIIFNFGEEKLAKKIAKKIVEYRIMESTLELHKNNHTTISINGDNGIVTAIQTPVFRFC